MINGRVLGVKVTERVPKLLRPLQDQRSGKGHLLLNHGAQVFAGDEIHHQVLAVILGEIIDDARQVRVFERCQQAGFADELCAGMGAEVVVGFYRYLVGQTLILCQVHFTHSTFAQQIDDLIP